MCKGAVDLLGMLSYEVILGLLALPIAGAVVVQCRMVLQPFNKLFFIFLSWRVGKCLGVQDVAYMLHCLILCRVVEVVAGRLVVLLLNLLSCFHPP